MLGAVKTEFEKFGGMLEKSQRNIQLGLNDLDTLIGTRSNMIRSKLKSIESLSESDTKMMLPEILAIDADDEA